MLEKANFPLASVNGSLAYMTDNKADGAAAALEFLKTGKDIWGPWVSDEARAKIEAGL